MRLHKHLNGKFGLSHLLPNWFLFFKSGIINQLCISYRIPYALLSSTCSTQFNTFLSKATYVKGRPWTLRGIKSTTFWLGFKHPDHWSILIHLLRRACRVSNHHLSCPWNDINVLSLPANDSYLMTWNRPFLDAINTMEMDWEISRAKAETRWQ